MKRLGNLLKITGMHEEAKGKRAERQPRTIVTENAVLRVKTEDVFVNPFQPRKEFDQESLWELSESIRDFGILQPLLVRKGAYGYELIAGERRLRAAKLAGCTDVPVLVREMTDAQMAEIALIENLQRENLHFFEEAEGLQRLLTEFCFTQEKLAVRMGKKQSTIANKLRLLRLSVKVRQIIQKEKLSERHARALLAIEDEETQLRIVEEVCQGKLTVRQTEQLVQRAGQKKNTSVPQKQNVVRLVRDPRIFLNTLNHIVTEMKRSGLNVEVEQRQERDVITVTMRVPKHR
ncbi:MAG: ParB/RepB/Spo0J family partition protein [Selenomonadales bacterium]|nr:ParB/RepB/Spo0J family partition protein [Selenomonadales bacterium]